MTPVRRASCALLACALLLSACVAVPPAPAPAPRPFLSPLARGMILPHYMPLLLAPKFDLGPSVAFTYSDRGTACDDARRLRAGWLYDWSPQPPLCDTILSLPMVWGSFDSKTCPALGPGSLVLGFNEPDRKDQANLTPEQAARLWHRLTVECYPERVFATPATYMSDGYLALDWLSGWVTEYVKLYGEQMPTAKYMAVHCFTWKSADTCKMRITQAKVWAQGHFLAGIIVTEWAVLPGGIGQGAARREATELRRWMEADPYIIGHAWTATYIEGHEKWWFGAENNTALLDFTTGELTAWGAWWLQ